MGAPATLLGPEASLLDPTVFAPDGPQSAGLLFWRGEESEDAAHRLEFRGRVIAQQSGEGSVSSQEGAVAAEETETDRGIIGEGAQQTLGIAQRVLDPPPGRHRFPEVAHLLAQAGDLMNQLLLGTVLVAHARCRTASRAVLAPYRRLKR